MVHGIEEEFTCNLAKKSCNCKNYLKYKICPHLLAANELVAEIEKVKLVNFPKRGR